MKPYLPNRLAVFKTIRAWWFDAAPDHLPDVAPIPAQANGRSIIPALVPRPRRVLNRCFACVWETAKSLWRARPDIRGNLSHAVCILVGNRKHRRLGQVPAGPGLGSSCFFLLPCLCLVRRGVRRDAFRR